LREALISSSAVPDDELAPGTVDTTAVDSDTGPGPGARGERSSGEPNPPWSGRSSTSTSSADRLNIPVVFMVSSWSALETNSSSSADRRAANSSSSSSVIPNLDGVLFCADTAASAASSWASE